MNIFRKLSQHTFWIFRMENFIPISMQLIMGFFVHQKLTCSSSIVIELFDSVHELSFELESLLLSSTQTAKLVAMTTPILLSIKPVYVDLIISQKKTIEIRKKIGKEFKINSWVYIYSSAPVKAIVARFQISKIIAFSDNDITEELLESSCLSFQDLTSYTNKNLAYAIFIKNLVVFDSLKLSEIRKDYPQFYPPQSFLYISNSLWDFIAYKNCKNN